MGEPTSTATVSLAVAAASAAAGAASAPLVEQLEFLPQIGVHWPSMVAGLLGVIIVQTLLPEPNLTRGRLALLTVGSMLFASIATWIFGPIALAVLERWPAIDPVPARAAVSALLGGFAHPVLMRIRRKVSGEPAAPTAKEGGTPNA